jgi:hypothetical protein
MQPLHASGHVLCTSLIKYQPFAVLFIKWQLFTVFSGGSSEQLCSQMAAVRTFF